MDRKTPEDFSMTEPAMTHDAIMARSAEVLHGNVLTEAIFAHHVATLGWRIGRLSYGVPQIVNYLAHRTPHLEIGSFCSIAANVEILFGGAHHIDFITSYPIGFAKAFVGDQVRLDILDDRHAEVRIGHDVWLGRDSLIMGGVSIGTGAVIGARAVVSKDVEPYAIMAGNPARMIRKRFDDRAIEKLLASAWWDLPIEAIERLQPTLLAGDVGAFIAALASETEAMQKR